MRTWRRSEGASTKKGGVSATLHHLRRATLVWKNECGAWRWFSPHKYAKRHPERDVSPGGEDLMKGLGSVGAWELWRLGTPGTL